MTIESKLDALTLAINNLAAAFAGKQSAPAPVAAAPAPVQQPIAPPVATAPAPTMPPPPVFAMPAAPAPAAAPTAPFSDAKGLLSYVMASYTALGAAKGAQIQNVLTSLGVANINDVKPEQYAALFAGVEALKAS